MCNACGFGCCALDTFDGCGCEDCRNPECWPVDVDDDEWEDHGREDDAFDYCDRCGRVPLEDRCRGCGLCVDCCDCERDEP